MYVVVVASCSTVNNYIGNKVNSLAYTDVSFQCLHIFIQYNNNIDFAIISQKEQAHMSRKYSHNMETGLKMICHCAADWMFFHPDGYRNLWGFWKHLQKCFSQSSANTSSFFFCSLHCLWYCFVCTFSAEALE